MNAQEENSDLLERWVRALNGRALPGTSPELLREAAIVRDLVTHRAGRRLDSPREHELQRFLFRLRQEKIIASRPARPGLYALAASLIALAATLLILQPGQEALPPGDAGSTWRGGEKSQHLRADRPAETASKLEILLSAHGVAVRRQVHGQQIQLQARIPPDATALREALRAEGISVPDHGRLDLLLTP
jgi:hypothetical protein